MRRPLSKLVVVCLLLLVLVTPRAPSTAPPIVSRSASPQDWSGLRTKLDEQAYRAAATATTSTTTTAPRKALRVSRNGLSHRGWSSAKECVSMQEHGGSYTESDNPTHKGRYQFARPTWIAFGGPPEHWDDWSLTSPAEQDEVFERAWNSPGGPGNWLPYDHCG